MPTFTRASHALRLTAALILTAAGPAACSLQNTEGPSTATVVIPHRKRASTTTGTTPPATTPAATAQAARVAPVAPADAKSGPQAPPAHAGPPKVAKP